MFGYWSFLGAWILVLGASGALADAWRAVWTGVFFVIDFSNL
jgi:hypothetical protein